MAGGKTMLMRSVENYLAVRRLVGFKLDNVEKMLRSYASFAAEHGDSHVVSKTATNWASEARSEAQREKRLKTVRRFAQFVRAEDSRHELPPEGVFCGPWRRPTPYIFSEEEIRQLVTQTSGLDPHDSLRPHTYSTLFGLLAVTGLRVSEALALRIGDLTSDGLVIREAKFRKSRLIPLHSSVEEALERYLERRRKCAGADDHFFVSRLRGGLSYSVVLVTFQQVLEAAGIRGTPGRRRPRLIDLRHTFAVRALENCPDDRDHVRRHMLALSTYMGHAHVESTYWYLESTPQLLADIVRSSEAFVHGGTP